MQPLRRRGEVALWSRGEERLDGRPRNRTGGDGASRWLRWMASCWPGTKPRPATCLHRAADPHPAPQTRRGHPAQHAGACSPTTCWNSMARTCAKFHCSNGARGSPRSSVHWAMRASSCRPTLPPATGAGRGDVRCARERGVEGLMLKRRTSSYQAATTRRLVEMEGRSTHDRRGAAVRTGRARPTARCTPTTPLVCGRRHAGAGGQGVFRPGRREILALDRWIRANTRERFGPVRSVRAEQVFELGFEAVNRSSRHPASPCASCASCAGATTSPPARPISWPA